MGPARAGASAVAAVLAAAGLLLVLVTWAASIGPDRVSDGGGGTIERSTATESPTTMTPEPGAADPQRTARRIVGDPPDWVRTVAFVLEVLTGCVVLYLLVRAWRSLRERWAARRRKERRDREEVEFEVLDTPAQLTDAIEDDAEQQRAVLEDGAPRNAIVGCWHRFEVQAARVGLVRRPWQTTSEFVLEVLAVVRADQGGVAGLAELYREARFSDHALTEEHRRRAQEALDAIHRSLVSRPESRVPGGMRR